MDLFLWGLLWVKDYVRAVGDTFYGSHLIRPHYDGSYISQAGQHFLRGMAVGIAHADADDGIGRHDGPQKYIGIIRRNGLQDRLAGLQSRQGYLKDKFENIREYLSAIGAEGRISRFHEVLWLNSVSRAIVQPDGTIEIEFK